MGINKVNYGSTTLIDISNDTVTAGSMLSGTTAHDNSGAAITGSIESKSSSDLTASGATVTVPAGCYTSQASKSVATGSVTATAWKDAVSEYYHNVRIVPQAKVAPSGYIAANTYSGNAVMVEVSELAFGDITISSNGTHDVTNYATATVSVPSKVGTASKSNSSATATSLAFSGLNGSPKAFAVRLETALSRNSSSSYYYITTMQYDGTNTYGNYWRMSTGNYYADTTHYSFTYSSGTLTVKSSGSRTAAGGSFYNGTYELVYVY